MDLSSTRGTFYVNKCMRCKESYCIVSMYSQHKDLTIELTKKPLEMPEFDATTLRFGVNSTDHMLSVDYNSAKGGR